MLNFQDVDSAHINLKFRLKAKATDRFTKRRKDVTPEEIEEHRYSTIEDFLLQKVYEAAEYGLFKAHIAFFSEAENSLHPLYRYKISKGDVINFCQKHNFEYTVDFSNHIIDFSS
ncbi:MAG: hypothetical protein E7314_07645 [Clostridiales bacterium]|nr:hypothetical protein [Clostridiales bacterium]